MKALLVTATSFTGGELARALRRRGDEVAGTYSSRPRPGLSHLDVREEAEVSALLIAVRPDVLFLTGALASADACELRPADALAVNVGGAGHVAAAAAAVGAKLVYYSSDYVFDGSSGPYGEDDELAPLNVYGRARVEAEQVVLATAPHALVIRTAGIYGWDSSSKNFAVQLWEQLSAGQPMLVPEDQVSTPTPVDYLVDVSLQLVDRGADGVVHVAGRDLLSRYDFARALAGAFELDVSLVTPVLTSSLEQPAPRPLRSGLRTDRLQALLGTRPPALAAGLEELRRRWLSEMARPVAAGKV